MLSSRQVFFQHLAQTSSEPMALEIVKAEGVYLYDTEGKEYMDLISGISVNNIGHCHPKVINAIKKQLDHYMHLMVYGEYIQTPQTELAHLLARQLPKQLQYTYFVNSGSEAVEGALKLAKRYTQRTEIIAFKNAYHGSTHGALSVTGNEYLKNSFRPLLPDIRFIEFNNEQDLNFITEKTACVIAESIQGEAGIIIPSTSYMQQLKKTCEDKDALLILDEIQTGFGRTGNLFAFENYNIVPDILVLAKGMGGGMPIGAFVSTKEIMSSLINNPELGHITTFGGHPVCCAASLASLRVILDEKLVEQVSNKEKIFRKLLVHPHIKSIRAKGLLFAVEFESVDFNKKLMKFCINNGVIVDRFLFAESFMRIAPPLTISEKEIERACEMILYSLNQL